MTDKLAKIKSKWDLPIKYLGYLSTHPKSRYIEGENFVNELYLYGSSDLVKNQDGYSYNPEKKEKIKDWPEDYVVIADDGADPYVLDLSKSNGEDAPILFAYHGEGIWDFSEYAPSFEKFLESLGVK